MTNDPISKVPAHLTQTGNISVRCKCGHTRTVPRARTGRTCAHCRRFVYVYAFNGTTANVEIDE